MSKKYSTRPINTSVLYCIKAIDGGEIYTTDERVIGTWIDGKPVYQKTFVNTLPVVTSDFTDVTKDISIGASLESVCNIFGYVNNNGSAFPFPVIVKEIDNFFFTKITAVRTNTATTGSSNVITLSNNRIYFSNVPVVITIQYTKTTDT